MDASIIIERTKNEKRKKRRKNYRQYKSRANTSTLLGVLSLHIDCTYTLPPLGATNLGINFVGLR